MRELEIIEHSRPDDKASDEEKDRGREDATIREVGEKERREERDRKNEEPAHPFTLHGQPEKYPAALFKEMQKSDRPEKEKRVTKSATSKPEEEFIEQKGRPSRDEQAAPKPAPPKRPKAR
jgi:hypothetical protein